MINCANCTKKIVVKNFEKRIVKVWNKSYPHFFAIKMTKNKVMHRVIHFIHNFVDKK